MSFKNYCEELWRRKFFILLKSINIILPDSDWKEIYSILLDNSLLFEAGYPAPSKNFTSWEYIYLNFVKNTKILYKISEILGRGWPEAENHILENAYYSALYAINFKPNGKWPEAEAIISTDPSAIYIYSFEDLF